MNPYLTGSQQNENRPAASPETAWPVKIKVLHRRDRYSIRRPTHAERQEAWRMSWFLEALRTYAAFSGRSRRKEYRYFVLSVVIISSVVLSMLDSLLGTIRRGGSVEQHL